MIRPTVKVPAEVEAIQTTSWKAQKDFWAKKISKEESVSIIEEGNTRIAELGYSGFGRIFSE